MVTEFNIAADIVYPENPDPVKVIEVEEFRQMITTCNLVATIHKDSPNTAVRKACKRMLETFQGPRSRKILAIAIKSPMPQAYIDALHRRLRYDEL